MIALWPTQVAAVVFNLAVGVIAGVLTLSACDAWQRGGPDVFAMEIGGRAVELFCDGPYGAATEDVFGYEVMILVGAGIGVTPFASVLKTLAIQMRQDRLETQLTKVQFYWVCRDEAEFDSFKDLLTEIVNDSNLARVFSLNTYITGELDLKKFTQKGQVEKFHQFAGKPDWNRIGKELRGTYKDSDVGVFLCGPAAIGNQLKKMCDKYNPTKEQIKLDKAKGKKRQPRFVFHSESF